MTPNRITLVSLGVTDLARARAFYEALGWVLEEATDDVAFYDLGGSKFGLYHLHKLAEDLGKPVTELGKGAMNLCQNYPSEKDVDTAFQMAIDAGGTALKSPAKIFWGGYSCNWSDPDGHVWEYAYNPFWPLDKNGRIA